MGCFKKLEISYYITQTKFTSPWAYESAPKLNNCQLDCSSLLGWSLGRNYELLRGRFGVRVEEAG